MPERNDETLPESLVCEIRRAPRAREGAARGVGVPASDRAEAWGGAPPEMDRRSFLRGSALFAAALGAGLVAPLSAVAQDPEKKKPDEKKNPDDKNKKTDDKNKKTEETQKEEKQKEEKQAKKADKEEKKPQEGKPEEGKKTGEQPSGTETKVDEKGREYRSCPQCGYNMYRQGRTWTCENCGYSYVE
jgi:predicted RNA-binding Zn-ribbon protein involved in translation (DUF1610 family)